VLSDNLTKRAHHATSAVGLASIPLMGCAASIHEVGCGHEGSPCEECHGWLAGVEKVLEGLGHSAEGVHEALVQEQARPQARLGVAKHPGRGKGVYMRVQLVGNLLTLEMLWEGGRGQGRVNPPHTAA
jgi:hypothetical protein